MAIWLAYDRGESVASIAKRYGVSRQRIYQLLNQRPQSPPQQECGR